MPSISVDVKVLPVARKDFGYSKISLSQKTNKSPKYHQKAASCILCIWAAFLAASAGPL